MPVGYRVPEKEKAAEKLATKFLISVEGKKIQGYRWGDSSGGGYILLVHGWAGRATQFRKFIEPLQAAGFSIIGVDGPAHGQSEGVKTSILEFEKMFKAIIEAEGKPAGVITHSFGGAAVLYAVMHGLPVRQLVNIASPSIADEILKTYLRAINGSWISAAKFKQFVLKKTGKPFEEFTALHAVRNLVAPINLLMIHDEDDKDVIMRHAEELMKVYPHAKLFRTSGLGHTRILKDEQVIAKTIEFLVENRM